MPASGGRRNREQSRKGGGTGKVVAAAGGVPCDWGRRLDARLRYYGHTEPDTLTDEERAVRVNELKYSRAEEAEATNGHLP